MTTKSVRFKLGMIVKINSDYTGLNQRTSLNELVSEYGYKWGEHVRLLSYNSSHETWRVEKVTPGESEYQWLWIKRKNLAPISSTEYVENNSFKVGDKVELIDARICEWAKHDRVTTGIVYEVTQATKYDPISQTRPFIKLKGGNATGIYWIDSAAFMKVEKSTSTTKSLPSKKETVEEDTEGIVEMVCVNVGVWNPYLTAGKTYKIHTKRQHSDGTYKVSGLDQPFKANGGGIDKDGSVYLTIERYFASPEKAETKETETEAPAPLRTFKTGDRVRFIQANTDKSFYNRATYYTKEAGLIDGEIYTVLYPTSNYGPNSSKPLIYIKTKEAPDFNHPVDCFEKVKKVMCVNNSGTQRSFTIGKVYEVTRETVEYYKLTDDSGRPNQGMYKHRFVEITDDIDKR